MASTRALDEAETPQQPAHRFKADVRVGATAEELHEKLVMTSHSENLPLRLGTGHAGAGPSRVG